MFTKPRLGRLILGHVAKGEKRKEVHRNQGQNSKSDSRGEVSNVGREKNPKTNNKRILRERGGRNSGKSS